MNFLNKLQKADDMQVIQLFLSFCGEKWMIHATVHTQQFVSVLSIMYTSHKLIYFKMN